MTKFFVFSGGYTKICVVDVRKNYKIIKVREV